MSTCRRCDVVELNPGEWFVFVAIEEYDFEFRSFQTFGPFATDDEAWDDGLSSVSNPGGGRTYNYGTISEDSKAMYFDMLKRPAPVRRRNCW